MRAVITGGAGFIGSHLCERLLSEGWEVICLDSLLTGSPRNVDHLFGQDGFTFVRYDVTAYIHVVGHVDYILHWASPASPADYLRYPIETLKAGSLGTLHALGLAKEKKATFVLASTSEVYGDPLVNPQPEDYWGNVNPVGPRGVYDEAKRFAEAMTVAYHRHHGVDVRIVRIFNTYGPRMRREDGRAVPTFMGQALRGEDITVYGDGSQTRSFCYIDDMVQGIYKLLLSDYTDPVNLGNPEEITVLDVAKRIIEVTGSDSRIVFEPLPVDDPRVRRPDISLAKKILGWEPKVRLDEGLRNLVAYLRADEKRWKDLSAADGLRSGLSSSST